MNNFFIITNVPKDPELKNTLKIKKYLEEKGKTCYVHSGRKNADRLYKYTNAAELPADVDCVLVLGGDGTLLQAARDLVERQLPLLGINFGTLGYLAEIEFTNFEPALDRLIEDNFSIEDRMMLQGSVVRQGREVLSDIALNDIVIARRGHLRVVDFRIYVNDTFLCSFRADGIIVSSPTGSTGYSLSAGGPIVAPDASLLMITAIAPHTISSRPIILPDDVCVTVEIGGNPERILADGAEVTFDGDTAMSMNHGDQVKISKAGKRTKMIKINNTSFVELLRTKMN